MYILVCINIYILVCINIYILVCINIYILVCISCFIVFSVKTVIIIKNNKNMFKFVSNNFLKGLYKRYNTFKTSVENKEKTCSHLRKYHRRFITGNF
jgi:hypothetical protein